MEDFHQDIQKEIDAMKKRNAEKSLNENPALKGGTHDE